LEKVRRGELDARRVLVDPERNPGADNTTVAALLDAEPSIGAIANGGLWGEGELDAPIGRLEQDRRLWIADLLSYWRSVPADVSQVTSSQDPMYAKTPDAYFPTGAAALRCVRLALLEARKDTCGSILDFACGYGRVLRYLRAAFPKARLTAADTTRDAVDFCAQEFGATPVYSQEDFASLELPGPFDLIWVGSLFTHVSAPRWIELLDRLESVLSDDGVLVFTTQGRCVREQLVTGRPPWAALTAEAKRQIVDGYEEEGFGYADWIGSENYGTSLNTIAWACAQIESRPGLQVLGAREMGWGRQDVIVCQAARA
jgi:SAM-dependent methyltransferase